MFLAKQRYRLPKACRCPRGGMAGESLILCRCDTPVSTPLGGQENQCNSALWHGQLERLVQKHTQRSNVHHPPGHSLMSHANFLRDAIRLNVNSAPLELKDSGGGGSFGGMVRDGSIMCLDEPLEGGGPEVFAEDAFRLNLPTVEKRSLIAYRHRHLVERQTCCATPFF